MEKLIAKYSAKGHAMYPEDTWDWEREISSENELYNFMVAIHKRDASHFNDYPLNGGCGQHGFTFEIEKSIVVDGETFVNPNRISVERPDYFESAYKKYEALYKRMRSTLPELRKIQRKKQDAENERNQYELLKSKFESQ